MSLLICRPLPTFQSLLCSRYQPHIPNITFLPQGIVAVFLFFVRPGLTKREYQIYETSRLVFPQSLLCPRCKTHREPAFYIALSPFSNLFLRKITEPSWMDWLLHSQHYLPATHITSIIKVTLIVFLGPRGPLRVPSMLTRPPARKIQITSTA